MVPFTKEQQRNYKQTFHCPYCGSENCGAPNEIQLDEDEAYQIVVCDNCERSWKDVYLFTHIEEI